MATSGTYSFNLDIAEAIEEAYERAGSELRSGYDYRTARRSLDLMFLEWQNSGLNLWTVQNDSQLLVAGESSFDLSVDQLDVVEATLRTDAGDVSNQSDIMMKRISVSNYARQTNKLQQGRPTQYYVQQKKDRTTIHLWPVPDKNTYVFNYYYIGRIEDTGKPGSNTLAVPGRFLPVMVSGLAFYLAQKIPSAASKVPMLEALYAKDWKNATEAFREKASFFVKPGGYR